VRALKSWLSPLPERLSAPPNAVSHCCTGPVTLIAARERSRTAPRKSWPAPIATDEKSA
jgi:hypothetical protein